MSNFDTEKRFLNVSDMAKRYGVSSRTIVNWRKQGKIPAPLGIGRWNIDTLEAWEATAHE